MRIHKFATLCLALALGASLGHAQNTSATEKAKNKDKSSENWKTNNSADQKITNGPVIEYVSDKSAVVAWSTKKAGGTFLAYGTDRNNLDKKADHKWGGTNHRVDLKGLQPNTTYYFQVRSADAKGSGADVESAVEELHTKNVGEKAEKHNQNVGVNHPTSASAKKHK